MPRTLNAQIIWVQVPPLNWRLRNIFRSTMGSAVRASIAMKIAAATAAIVNVAMICGHVQAPARGGCPGFAYRPGGDRERDHAHRDVDQEDPAPVEVLADQAAGHR